MLNKQKRDPMSLFRRIITRLKPESKIAKVCIPEMDLDFSVQTPCTILKALRSKDIDIDHFCGGVCSCGTCIIQVEGELSAVQSREKLVLGYSRIKSHRLACQAKILGDVIVHLP
jgi:ferredoxin